MGVRNRTIPPLLTQFPDLMDPCPVIHAHCKVEWPQGNEGGLHCYSQAQGRVLEHGDHVVCMRVCIIHVHVHMCVCVCVCVLDGGGRGEGK